jgi:hypothetical protein
MRNRLADLDDGKEPWLQMMAHVHGRITSGSRGQRATGAGGEKIDQEGRGSRRTQPVSYWMKSQLMRGADTVGRSVDHCHVASSLLPTITAEQK